MIGLQRFTIPCDFVPPSAYDVVDNKTNISIENGRILTVGNGWVKITDEKEDYSTVVNLHYVDIFDSDSKIELGNNWIEVDGYYEECRYRYFRR